MKTGIQPGKVLDLTAPGGGVVSDQGYIIGGLLVVATHDAAATETFAALTEEVVEMAVNAADTPAEGAEAWWDDSGKEWRTASASGRYPAGTFVAAKNASNLVKVKLKGFATVVVP